ncbi:hypothetical protein F2Q68_00006614 [Brassica cretica]|uniref:Uncharacterized protein n=2 Tax=Brassica cretica TaxID=69181 RepID=A0A8S9JL97_BRACR|nr:hypothetical protein F2Q68_00006614 [Brassica cretica]KAF3542329.1 hypothetical protein DY000_02010182 [Brassica cretica]
MPLMKSAYYHEPTYSIRPTRIQPATDDILPLPPNFPCLSSQSLNPSLLRRPASPSLSSFTNPSLLFRRLFPSNSSVTPPSCSSLSFRHPAHPPSCSSLLLCKKEEDKREIRNKEDEIHRHLLRSSWVIEDEEEDDRPETM